MENYETIFGDMSIKELSIALRGLLPEKTTYSEAVGAKQPHDIQGPAMYTDREFCLISAAADRLAELSKVVADLFRYGEDVKTKADYDIGQLRAELDLVKAERDQLQRVLAAKNGGSC